MLEAAKEKWDATAIYWIEINWIILPKHEWGFGQLGFPSGSGGKESPHNEGDVGSIPGFGRSPGEGNSYPLQYSGLENSMDRSVWQATDHAVSKSQTQLSNFHFGQLAGWYLVVTSEPSINWLLCLIYFYSFC